MWVTLWNYVKNFLTSGLLTVFNSFVVLVCGFTDWCFCIFNSFGLNKKRNWGALTFVGFVRFLSEIAPLPSPKIENHVCPKNKDPREFTFFG